VPGRRETTPEHLESSAIPRAAGSGCAIPQFYIDTRV